MLAIVNVILPVFALMVLGYSAVRFRLFPAEGVRGLVMFVNNFATPCLLFYAMATSDFTTTFNWSVIGSFYAGALVVFASGILISQHVFKDRPGESVASGFSGTFTNTVLIGIPILQRAYGEDALVTAFSIIAFHASMLITLGMLVMEFARRDGAALHKTLWVAFQRIIANPLLWGIALGVAVNLLNIGLIEPVNAFVTMMAAAVTPAALFGLGGALNEYRLSDSWAQSLAMSLLKLLVQPAAVFAVAHLGFGLTGLPLQVAVMMAALPTGSNALLFAQRYQTLASEATATIVFSTLAFVGTATAWLALLAWVG